MKKDHYFLFIYLIFELSPLKFHQKSEGVKLEVVERPHTHTPFNAIGGPKNAETCGGWLKREEVEEREEKKGEEEKEGVIGKGIPLYKLLVPQ
jgi:hypothetical protein